MTPETPRIKLRAVNSSFENGDQRAGKVRHSPESRHSPTRLLCPNGARGDHYTAAKYYSISGNSVHIHGTRVPVEEPKRTSAKLYSITSSARARSDGGMLRPSVFAVRMFSTNSNFVGCSIGRSAGLTPCRILCT
jgi:hypothetical protein